MKKPKILDFFGKVCYNGDIGCENEGILQVVR